jgi:Holliday junction resolvase RusA-like endonuclease
MIELTIPGEPMGKQRARVVRSKAGFPVAYTPAKTKNYETLVRELFAVKYPDFTPLDAPIDMTICAYRSIPKSASKRDRAAMAAGEIRPTGKPDISNIIKIVEDALNGVAYRDDSLVVLVSGAKYYGARPRTEIFISMDGEGKDD